MTPTAARIAAALLQSGIRARPVAEHAGPGLTLYRLALPPAAMARALRTQPALAAALDNPGVTVGQAGALLEVCRPTRAATVSLDRVGPCLGVAASGERVTLTLDRHQPHAIIGGMTGSGKSELLRTLALLESRRAETTLILVDLKDSGQWSELAALGHTVCVDAASTRAALTWAVGRIGAGEPGRVVVIVDEAARLDSACRALALEIAERGRADGVHLVAATQYIRADVVDRRLTTSADWRIAGRVFDGQASRLILGQAGAEHLTGRGDMLLSAGGAPAIRFRAALADGAAWARAGQGTPLELAGVAADETVHPGHVIRLDWEAMIEWAIENAPDGQPTASGAAIRRQFRCGSGQATRARDMAAERIIASLSHSEGLIRPDFAAMVAGMRG